MGSVQARAGVNGFTRKELVDEAELRAHSHYPGRTQDIAFEIKRILENVPADAIKNYEGEV